MKGIMLFFISGAIISGFNGNMPHRKITLSTGNRTHLKAESLNSQVPEAIPVDMNNYKLVFTDDFNGSSLNTKIWDYLEENSIRGFGKMLRSNVAVSGGTLKLYAAKKMSAKGEPSFSASMISTQYSLNQKYGYFEIRAKMNSQTGPHSAFWLQQHSVGTVNKVPNPSIYGAEVDIFEYHRGTGTENLYFGLHWNGYDFTNGSHQTISSSAVVPGISTGFHKFALEWTPKKYTVYVDGIEKAQTTQAISHIPQFIILSTEITGYGGDRFKMDSSVRDVFEVDYIKVYARKPAVHIYGDCDGYGWISEGLLPGKYTTAQLAALGVIDNQASAIELPEGWSIKAFDGDNFSSDNTTIKKSQGCIENFNDRLSSLIIIASGK